MGRNKTPQLQAHTRKPARGSDDSDQQPVKDHHVNGAQATGNPGCKRGKCHAQVIGHDGTGRNWLDPDDGMGPHLMTVNGCDHLRSENLHLEVRIMVGQSHAHDGRSEKYDKCDQAIVKILAKDPRVSISKVINDGCRIRPLGGINGIVCPRQQLVQVPGKMN